MSPRLLAARRWLGELLEVRRRSARFTVAERDEITSAVFSDGPGEFRPYLYRLAVLMALSTAIAAMGLIINSPAVVIGAMLVAPLMQPIIGFASALVLRHPRREIVSLVLVLLATLESFGFGALIGLIVPTFRVVTVTPELLSRTSPALLDLGIAVAAGAAGAYVTIRPRAGGAIAGAAIAVALVPPLAAAGVLLSAGFSGLARGAILLYLTNLFGIVLAAVIVFVATGFVARGVMTRSRRLAILLPLLVVLAVAYPLSRRTISTYHRALDETTVRQVLVPTLRANGLGITSLLVAISKGQLVASIDVVGPNPPPPTDGLSMQLAEALGRPVRLILRWTQRQESISESDSPGGSPA